MKKLIAAVAAIAMAFGLQAASVDWSLAQNSAAYKTGTWNVYAFAGDVTAAAVTALSSNVETDWTTFLGTSKGTLSTGRGSLNGSTTGYTGTGTEYLTFVLVDGNVENGSAWQVLNAANVSANVYEPPSTGTKFSYAITANIASTGTLESVPEPTSGLLLLLGMAGLALKRKQA